MKPFAIASVLAFLLTTASIFAQGPQGAGPRGPAGPHDSAAGGGGAQFGPSAQVHGAGLTDEEFDRLDGHGPSGKKVNVIEWEGNLEIHVYPGGSLAGLSMKVDRSQKSPVMVIGYRFRDRPEKTLIRRAVLGIPMADSFQTYRDPSISDYDKIIVSSNGLSGQVVAYRLDPAPKQLYPDGHPMNAHLADAGGTRRETYGPRQRMPASAQPGRSGGAAMGEGSAGAAPGDEPSEGSAGYFSW